MSEFFRKSLYRPTAPSLVVVERVAPVSPGLLRLTLTGEALEGFPEPCPAAHVKLFLPRPGQDAPILPRLGPNGPVWPEGAAKPIVRTYSVRAFRKAAREVDVEFALHDGVEGPATSFARRAEPGARLGLSYPGGPDPMIPAARSYHFAGDLSTVPALASILEHLPVTAEGTVSIRADDVRDVRELAHPAGVAIRWFVAPPTETAELVAAFEALPPSQDAFYWIGGEHALVVALRRHLVVERGVAKEALYALPYWRHTLDEEAYHRMRDDVMNEEVRA